MKEWTLNLTASEVAMIAIAVAQYTRRNGENAQTISIVDKFLARAIAIDAANAKASNQED